MNIENVCDWCRDKLDIFPTCFDCINWIVFSTEFGRPPKSVVYFRSFGCWAPLMLKIYVLNEFSDILGNCRKKSSNPCEAAMSQGFVYFLLQPISSEIFVSKLNSTLAFSLIWFRSFSNIVCDLRAERMCACVLVCSRLSSLPYSSDWVVCVEVLWHPWCLYCYLVLRCCCHRCFFLFSARDHSHVMWDRSSSQIAFMITSNRPKNVELFFILVFSKLRNYFTCVNTVKCKARGKKRTRTGHRFRCCLYLKFVLMKAELSP